MSSPEPATGDLGVHKAQSLFFKIIVECMRKAPAQGENDPPVASCPPSTASVQDLRPKLQRMGGTGEEGVGVLPAIGGL